MATSICLMNLTDQGIKNIKESPDRFNEARAMGEKMGLTIKAVYYTLGRYEMVVIVEGAEDAATAFLMKVTSLGNIRSQTLRAFSPDEMKRIIATMP